ncbi:MAG: membrane protein insertase YidC [Actinomycetota bacterium]
MLNTVLYPLEYAVAFIMVQFHSALSAVGLPPASGWTWALSIIGLVVVIRIILIPLFVKQIKASRGLQLIQPEMKKIQAKYKDKKDPESRQAMTQETMALYKETGTNPFASCLPILLQAPIFFALFRVLNQHVRTGEGIGPLTPFLAGQADKSTLLGAPLSSTFLGSGGNLNVKIITVILIILMSATTFTTQRQLMMKNMPASALDNPFAQQQKILLYVLPLVFAVSGVNFPIGVLLYWLTTNAWSMGQQFYVIRRMPAPGSLAEKALEDRRRRKGKGGGPDVITDTIVGEVVDDAPRQRQQPKRQPRSKRTPGPVKAPGTSSSAGSTAASEPASPGAPSNGASGAGSTRPVVKPQPVKRTPASPAARKNGPRPAGPPSSPPA